MLSLRKRAVLTFNNPNNLKTILQYTEPMDNLILYITNPNEQKGKDSSTTMEFSERPSETFSPVPTGHCSTNSCLKWHRDSSQFAHLNWVGILPATFQSAECSNKTKSCLW